MGIAGCCAVICALWLALAFNGTRALETKTYLGLVRPDVYSGSGVLYAAVPFARLESRLQNAVQVAEFKVRADNTRYGPPCVQFSSPDEHMNETCDCLHMNIVRPKISDGTRIEVPWGL